MLGLATAHQRHSNVRLLGKVEINNLFSWLWQALKGPRNLTATTWGCWQHTGFDSRWRDTEGLLFIPPSPFTPSRSQGRQHSTSGPKGVAQVTLAKTHCPLPLENACPNHWHTGTKPKESHSCNSRLLTAHWLWCKAKRCKEFLPPIHSI